MLPRTSASQDGPKADYATIPLPCAVPGDGAEALAGPGACTLDSFRQLAEPRSINGTAAWCGACENDSMSVCKLQRATAELQAVTAGDEGAGGGSSGLSGGAVAGIAIGCVAATLAACGVGFVMYRRRMLRQLEAARLVGVHQAGHA